MNVDIVSGMFLAVAAFLTVSTSAAKNPLKCKIIEKLANYEKSQTQKNSTVKKSVTTRQTSERMLFVAFLVMTTFNFVFCLLNAIIYLPVLFYFSLQYQIFSVTINVQCFQILCFANAFTNQLKALSAVDGNKISVYGLKAFKSNLISIHEIGADISKCFNLPMFLVTLWIFFSVLTNLHWIGAFFFGNPNAGIAGKFTYDPASIFVKITIADGIFLGCPSLFSILTLALSHRSTKKTLNSIVSNIARSKISKAWKEDILTFLVQKDFCLTSFGCLQLGFDSCMKVRKLKYFGKIFNHLLPQVSSIFIQHLNDRVPVSSDKLK